MTDLNTFELTNVEHQLVSTLLLQFARSVDQNEKTYLPDSAAYPVMFGIAKDILEKMNVEYEPKTKEG